MYMYTLRTFSGFESQANQNKLFIIITIINYRMALWQFAYKIHLYWLQSKKNKW